MSLIQPAPASTEEAPRPLDIPPDRVMEMDEEEWYEKVYQGADSPQLTLRAVAMGSALGFLLAFTNLYVGLKTGWASASRSRPRSSPSASGR